MYYAIGIWDGMTPTGFKLIRILNCSNQEFIGKTYCAKFGFNQPIPELMRFVPEDQFCEPVPLSGILEPWVK